MKECFQVVIINYSTCIDSSIFEMDETKFNSIFDIDREGPQQKSWTQMLKQYPRHQLVNVHHFQTSIEKIHSYAICD